MSTSTSIDFPLATSDPYTGGSDAPPGTANAGSNGSADNDAGAAGSSSGGNFELSQGGLIAIIIVVVLVSIIGITTAVLFYLAKKREWTVRETIRKSARKVVTALTPRRTEFPKSVKEGGAPKSRGGRTRIDDVPPTPRLKPEDLEKGLAVKVEAKRKYFHRP